MTRVQFLAGAMKNVFLFSSVSIPSLGPTQPLIRWMPVALSPGVKCPGLEADSSHLSSAEVKNAWSYTSTYPHVFMAWSDYLRSVCRHSDHGRDEVRTGSPSHV
jgi:hypothetical protein